PQARQEEEELEDAAHDPRRLPGDQEVRRLTGEPEDPQTLTVAAVNETHAVSVRRLANGRIIITICSPGCGEMILLLEAVSRSLHSGTDPAVRAQINEHLAEFRAAQARLETNPNDADAHQC